MATQRQKELVNKAQQKHSDCIARSQSRLQALGSSPAAHTKFRVKASGAPLLCSNHKTLPILQPLLTIVYYVPSGAKSPFPLRPLQFNSTFNSTDQLPLSFSKQSRVSLTHPMAQHTDQLTTAAGFAPVGKSQKERSFTSDEQ